MYVNVCMCVHMKVGVCVCVCMRVYVHMCTTVLVFSPSKIQGRTEGHDLGGGL